MKKKTKRMTGLLLAVVMVLSILAACGQTPGGENGDEKQSGESSVSSSESSPAESEAKTGNYPLTVSNFNYAKEPVEFTYEKAPERVITFWSNSLETMLALGLGDRIICAVGMNEEKVLPELKEELQKCTENMEYYNDFKDSNAALSKETAVMMEPDFILGWKSSFSEKTIGDTAYWNDKGVGTYIALNANDISEKRTLDNEYADILTIGKIFDVEDKAQALVDEMKAEVEKVTAAAKDQPKKTVLIAEFLKDKTWTYDETYLAGDMVKAMGGDLINTEREIGAENIVEIDPEVLLLIGDETDIQAVKDNPAFANLQSVKNNQVYAIDLSEVYTSGVRTIHGLNHIGQFLYPDLYQ